MYEFVKICPLCNKVEYRVEDSKYTVSRHTKFIYIFQLVEKWS